MDLTGKTAVVTGGGTGIGRAVAESLAQAGCRVVIAGRREDKLREVADQFSGPGEILCRAADMSDRESAIKLFEWSKQQLGQIDILVISAGVNIVKRSMKEMVPEDWDRVMSINATGAYNAMLCVLPEMRARKDGLIVNISSVAGIRASSLGGIAYSAAKFAQTALGTAVAREVGEEGVRITNVYPGEVNTPILENRPKPVDDAHKARILQPEDVAHAVMMVATLPPRAHIAELVIKPVWQDHA